MHAQLDERREARRERELWRPLGRQQTPPARDDGDVCASAERPTVAEQEAHAHRRAPGVRAAVAREGWNSSMGTRRVLRAGGAAKLCRPIGELLRPWPTRCPAQSVPVAPEARDPPPRLAG